MVQVPRAGERQSSDWLTADCEDLEKCLPQRSTSRDSGIKKCHMKKLFYLHVRTVLSKIFHRRRPHRGEINHCWKKHLAK